VDQLNVDTELAVCADGSTIPRRQRELVLSGSRTNQSVIYGATRNSMACELVE